MVFKEEREGCKTGGHGGRILERESGWCGGERERGGVDL